MSRSLALLGLALLLAAPLAAQDPSLQDPPADPQATDVAVLKNGDRLHGKLGGLDAGKLVFTSPILGEMKLAPEQLSDLRTADAAVFVLPDGTRVEQRIVGIDDKTLRLESRGPLALGDIARLNPPPDVPRWRGAVALGAVLTEGNTERRSANATAEVERRTETDRLLGNGAWDYAEEKSDSDWELAQRRVGGGLKYDYFLSRRSYLLANVSAQSDTLAQVDLRFTAGLGYGYQWYETETFALRSEIGANWFTEEFAGTSPDQEYVSARVAYAVRWRPVTPLELLQDLEAFPSIESSDDVYLKLDTRARLTIRDNLFTALQWIMDYDNTPAGGNERTDHRYLLTLGWNF